MEHLADLRRRTGQDGKPDAVVIQGKEAGGGKGGRTSCMGTTGRARRVQLGEAENKVSGVASISACQSASRLSDTPTDVWPRSGRAPWPRNCHVTRTRSRHRRVVRAVPSRLSQRARRRRRQRLWGPPSRASMTERCDSIPTSAFSRAPTRGCSACVGDT